MLYIGHTKYSSDRMIKTTDINKVYNTLYTNDNYYFFIIDDDKYFNSLVKMAKNANIAKPINFAFNRYILDKKTYRPF